VLGGAQSLHTNSLDETFALPSEKAVTIALRTQQILAHESGVANTIDPLGGSYFLETLTNEMEAAAEGYCERIDAMGGMVRAIERGYPQREIQESSYQFSKAVERKEKVIVGVNEFITEEQPPMDILIIDDSVQQRQCAKLRKLRAEREGARVERNLSALKRAAEGTENLMPHILDCVRSYATLGEISDALRAVWGEYREPSIF
jgi:methylmalonyl-CoA mutase N-terminal domain/subunit